MVIAVKKPEFQQYIRTALYAAPVYRTILLSKIAYIQFLCNFAKDGSLFLREGHFFIQEPCAPGSFSGTPVHREEPWKDAIVTLVCTAVDNSDPGAHLIVRTGWNMH